MGDEGGFDPCECIWGHEMAMRRLLALLRQSQSYCTDNECFPTGFGAQSQNLDNCFFVMIMMFIFAAAMFYFRPRSQRTLEDVSKPTNNSNDSNGAPPTPPPTAS